jgi:hypothetical protein
MFLTDDELQELTGYKLPSAQRRWLRERGWRHEVNRVGRPRVARAYCEARLGVAHAEDTDEPNWEALSVKAPKG